MKTLIGSQAALHHFPDWGKTNDVDYFTDDKTVPGDNFYHPDLEKWEWGDIATPDELYTLKISHSFWELRNNSWDKHVFHAVQLKKRGAVFLPELYSILYPIWEQTHGKKKANLELSPEEFFNKHVKRTYEHDSIHASVAYYDEPLFNRILRDNHEVAVDRSKFEAMPLEMKYQLVREEVYATALERQIIPSNYRENLLSAYSWALKKTITSFAKGWFPLFILLNFDDLRKPDLNFVQLHKNNSHKLIPLKE